MIPKIVIHRASTSSNSSSGSETFAKGLTDAESNSDTAEESELKICRTEGNDWPEEDLSKGSLDKKSGERRQIKPNDQTIEEEINQFSGGRRLSKFGRIIQELQSKTEKREPTFLQHIARRLHDKIGIRHFVMVGILATYSILGGLIFQTLERDFEMISLKKNKEALECMIDQMTNNITITLNMQPTMEQKRDVQLLITEYYQTMLKIEGKYIGSVFHKYEHIAVHLSWYFGSSVFYAITLFTTIGYGTMACQTTLGRIVSIFYAIFGIPLMLVVLSDVGQLLLRFFTFCYNRLRQSFRTSLRYLAFRILGVAEADLESLEHQKTQRPKDFDMSSESTSTESDEKICNGQIDGEESEDQCPLPVWFSMPIVLIYLALVALVVIEFDWPDPGPGPGDSGPGLDFGEAYYFVFISITTIGLGDVMPNNIEFSPILGILFLVGLALLSVVNTTLFMHIETCFLSTIGHLEQYLEDEEYCPHDQQKGYFVFQSLIPNIQLLTLVLPIFPDKKAKQIETFMGTYNPSEEIGRRRVFSGSSILVQTPQREIKRFRTYSTTALSDDEQRRRNISHQQQKCSHTFHGAETARHFFLPTLGILNTASPSRRGTVAGHDSRSRRASLVATADSSTPSPICRKRAITVGHFGNEHIDQKQERACRRSNSSVKQTRKPNNANKEEKDGRKYVRKTDSSVGAATSSASASKSSCGLRRAHSERLRPTERSASTEQQKQSDLYIIDECEPQQQTIACGEMRAQMRGIRRVGAGDVPRRFVRLADVPSPTNARRAARMMLASEIAINQKGETDLDRKEEED